MPADDRLVKLVAALVETLEHGMEQIQAVCNSRTDIYARSWSTCSLQCLFNKLAAHPANVHQLLLKTTEIGWQEGVNELAVQSGVLFKKHPHTAPAFRTGIPMTASSLTHLRALVKKGAVHVLVECAEHWKEGPDKAGDASGGKRNGAPGA